MESTGVLYTAATALAHVSRGLFYSGLAWAALFVVFATAMSIAIQPEVRRRALRRP